MNKTKISLIAFLGALLKFDRFVYTEFTYADTETYTHRHTLSLNAIFPVEYSIVSAADNRSAKYYTPHDGLIFICVFSYYNKNDGPCPHFFFSLYRKWVKNYFLDLFI